MSVFYEKPVRPDVVVLDLRLPGQSGLEVARSILAARPEQKIILFSACLEILDQREALRLGVTACVSKGSIADLPAAVWAAARTPVSGATPVQQMPPRNPAAPSSAA